MTKVHYYDLGYTFRNSKIWKRIYEEELFAVKLPSKRNPIGYCCVMGRDGEHMALAVYIGADGFTTYRIIANSDPDYMQGGVPGMFKQDCIQCSVEQRDMFDPDELDALRKYCEKSGTPFRAPYPQFTRYYPYCVPWKVEKADDWKAIETALLVVEKLAEGIKSRGKAALGLRPIAVGLNDQAYATEQLSFFGDPVDETVTIPLYSIVDGQLVTERIPLPPYTEKKPAPPTNINDIAVAKLMRQKQRGTLECEIIRMPSPIDGDPPYFPAIMMIVDENGYAITPVITEGRMYDPDEMINHFIESLDETYPKTIKFRTEETRILLEPFCRKARIRLEETDDMDLLDEAVESMVDYMLGDGDEEEDVDIEDMINMLDNLTVDQIRMLPDPLLNQIIGAAELFPDKIVRKIQKAMRE